MWERVAAAGLAHEPLSRYAQPPVAGFRAGIADLGELVRRGQFRR